MVGKPLLLPHPTPDRPIAFRPGDGMFMLRLRGRAIRRQRRAVRCLKKRVFGAPLGAESPEVYLLNRTDRPQPMPGEAEIKYLDGDFRIIRPGAFVRCAVTGVPIPLEELRYWSVDLQEPYATPEAVLQRQASAYKK